MRVQTILKTGLISGLMTLGVSCQKAPFRQLQSNVLKKETVEKLDSFVREGKIISSDTTYHLFGRDTLEISDKMLDDSKHFSKYLDKNAKKNTPKFETGKTLKTEMIPKTGGGFNYIPVMKPDYVPSYINQKTVINSVSVYTRDRKDLYIPVEYYGIKNPKAVKKQKKR